MFLVDRGGAIDLSFFYLKIFDWNLFDALLRSFDYRVLYPPNRILAIEFNCYILELELEASELDPFIDDFF